MYNSVFCNLARSNMLYSHVGVKGGEVNQDFKFGKDYSYIECKLADSCKTKLEAGQFVALFPTITVEPRKCKLQIVVNSELATVGALSYQSIIEPGDEHALGISLKTERDYDLNDLEWVCRIYCIYG